MAMDKRGPPEIKGMFSLKVDISGRPPSKWNPADLQDLFGKFGEVGDVFIPRTKFSDRQCGFAFVRFHKERDGMEAIRKMNGFKLEGSTLTVTRAQYGRGDRAGKEGKTGESHSARSPPRERERDKRDRSRDRGREPRRSPSRQRSPSSPPRRPRSSPTPVRQRAKRQASSSRRSGSASRRRRSRSASSPQRCRGSRSRDRTRSRRG
uniref:RRM domain-containing protein n=1 Tax=Alexandrium catenella TaxID=2925 RepID=A0A7S1WSJ0_ALECA